jgi:hypothetical protein
VRRRNAIVTIVHIAQCSRKDFRPNGSHPAHRIFVQQRISTNGHFHLGSLDKIHRWVELFKFLESDIGNGE